MFEIKLIKGQCGIYVLIYLKIIYFLIVDGIVDKIVCINYYELNNGCLFFGIKVKNCNDIFYVYCFVLIFGCLMVYCVGRVLLIYVLNCQVNL